MSKHEIGNDVRYNAGIPDLSGEKINAIYAAAGLDPVTGLPVAKSTSGKVALASGHLSAGVLSFSALTWAFVKAAKSCGCPSCECVLANIESSIRGFAENRPGIIRVWSRQNRLYFIQRLREIVLSQSIKHNVK